MAGARRRDRPVPDPLPGQPNRPARSVPDLGGAFRALRVPLYNYFRRCGVLPAPAEDLTQGVFLALLERPGGFDPSRGRFESYVFGVAANLRRRWRRRDERTVRESPRHEPAHSSEPVEIAALRQALAALGDDQREAVVLREFHGLSYDEIAEAQGVPVGTVRSRLARAREALRARLLPS